MKLLRRCFGLTCAFFSLLAYVPGAAAVRVINNFGLVIPAQTITFSEFVFPDGTVITNQYASLGVTFSPNLFYNPEVISVPNQSAPTLGNFPGGLTRNLSVAPFSILFPADQTRAAFSMITGPGNSTFEALFNSIFVESFVAPTDTTSSINFFGFMGITFDEIRITPGGINNAMLLDNLQTGLAAPSAVPEPASFVLLGIGLAALGIGRRRKTA